MSNNRSKLIKCVNCGKESIIDEMEILSRAGFYYLGCSCGEHIFEDDKGLRFMLDVKYLGDHMLVVVKGDVIAELERLKVENL